jgi:hypothetical protein
VPDAKTTSSATPKPQPGGASWRSGRRRRAAAGSLEHLRRELWHAARTVGAVLDDPDALPADVCRAANSLAALANSYRAVTEAADLLPRLEAVERMLAEGGRP